MIEPFLSAIPILNKLEIAGFEAYFVGGSVRDYLLNKEISDVDIATSATPEEVKKIFTKTVDVGIEHGTVLVLFNGGAYEITTFRSEAEYQDFRRPSEVSFIRNLKEDLQRRDFTMNAIAMDRDGILIDPFGGQSDIQQKVIQTVGKAEERFREDALRMMRAVRFVSQLSFTIEKTTLNALKKHNHLLAHIAVERKRVEFEKLLKGNDRKFALRLMLDTALYKYLPEMSKHQKNLEDLLKYPMEHLDNKEMWVLLIYCLKLEGKGVESFLRNWRLPLKEIKEIQLILQFTRLRLVQEWTLPHLFTAGRNIIISVEKLYQTISNIKRDEAINYWVDRYEKLPIKEKSEVDVTGSDIMDWFNKSGGPWLKETLTKIENAILEEIVPNDKQEIKEWLMKCSQK
ncbi:tRNA nucleotidyltransferase (CCA-adding enzyme) [Bacillus sp. SORGH_AS 510]|uniref:CCA tRNA nucleotidyltransferase n=1 Tax=Bacillus sp. SORGH_AS_0510 TaxID=3041771 RepID=UPI00277FA947|nr:CCA tRNA nucleotidyltransferase [Bacillus sp. SORGH_AS_0510]MDQ1145277.1 tRNA nucleotidyltransferase (CCA-adding enzyme) [Bacillus sp. SORGH_AS_0510]